MKQNISNDEYENQIENIGTSLNLNSLSEERLSEIKNIDDFTYEESIDIELNTLFKDEIEDSIKTGTLLINFKKLYDYSLTKHLKKLQERDVDGFIKDLEKSYKRITSPLYENILAKNIVIRFTNMEITPIHNLLSDKIGDLLCINGNVKGMSEIHPKLDDAVFECTDCMKIHTVKQKSNPTQPPKCNECGGRSFKLIQGQSTYIDSRTMIVEETNENKTTKQARKVTITLTNDLVNKIDIGDNIDVIGTLKARLNKKKNDEYMFYMDANNIINKKDEETKITPDEEKKIIKLSQEEDILQLLTSSVAPQTEIDSEIKLAILCYLVNGELPRNYDDDKNWINILIIADPATGKTRLGKDIIKLADKGRMADASHSTGAGLIAGAVKDEVLGKWILEAGAMALANKGKIVIDEFDKLSKEQGKQLLTAMQDGIVPINKAAIHENVECECGVLALGNPKYGSFDRYKPIIDQVNIYPPLLSRFDLVFLLPRETNQKKVEDKAWMIIKGNTNTEYQIKPDLLKKYLMYAKQIKTNISDKYKKMIQKWYVKNYMEGIVNDELYMDERALEGILRLTTAIAKLQLHNNVKAMDIELAISIKKYSLNQAGIDPITGNVDLGRINGTGNSQERRHRNNLLQLIYECHEYQENGRVSKTIIKEEFMSRYNLSDVTFYHIYNQLLRHEDIVEISLSKNQKDVKLSETMEEYFNQNK